MWSCGHSRLLGASLAGLLALAGAVSANAAPPERQVIATLGGEPIYRDQVEPSVALQVYKLEAQIHALLRRATEELADERLLAREAEARGMTLEELLQREVERKITAASEEEVEAYLSEHPAATTSGREARERVAFYLTERRRFEARLSFLERLRAEAGFQFLLAPPPAPRTEIDLDETPVRGASDAPVTLVHFAGFDRASAAIARTIRSLMEDNPGQIRWAHHHFFHRIDERALATAELAVAAQEAGRFWQLHDRLMALGGEYGEGDLPALAAELGLPSAESLDTPERQHRTLRVKRQLDLARKAGVDHAPAVFVNGRYYSGTFPASRLRKLVEEELGQIRNDIEEERP